MPLKLIPNRQALSYSKGERHQDNSEMKKN